MKAFVVLVVLLINFLPVSAQGPDYYQRIPQESFRKEKLFNDTLDFANIDLPRLNTLLFFVTNEIRAKNNLPVLEYSALLEKAATMHSRDMVLNDFFGHTNSFSPEKETPNDRARMAGITNPFIAENLAEDFGLQYESGTNVYILDKGKFSLTPDGKLIPPNTYLSLSVSLLERWMNSPQHKQNIFSPNALQMGCGTYFFIDHEFNDMPTFMATQNFQWYEKIEQSQK